VSVIPHPALVSCQLLVCQPAWTRCCRRSTALHATDGQPTGTSDPLGRAPPPNPTPNRLPGRGGKRHQLSARTCEAGHAARQRSSVRRDTAGCRQLHRAATAPPGRTYARPAAAAAGERSVPPAATAAASAGRAIARRSRSRWARRRSWRRHLRLPRRRAPQPKPQPPQINHRARCDAARLARAHLPQPAERARLATARRVISVTSATAHTRPIDARGSRSRATSTPTPSPSPRRSCSACSRGRSRCSARARRV
jgi:hypothetical protein